MAKPEKVFNWIEASNPERLQEIDRLAKTVLGEAKKSESLSKMASSLLVLGVLGIQRSIIIENIEEEKNETRKGS